MYTQVHFVDYDSDDDLDFYVWGYDENCTTGINLSVYENKGGDTFNSILVESSISYGSTVSSIGSADMNNDNIPEIVAIGGNDTYMHFTQYANSSFEWLKYKELEGIYGGDEHGFSFADYDNDGYEELLRRMTIYDPYELTQNMYNFGNIGDECTSWIDINNDGKSDIVRVHFGQYASNSNSYIHINKGGSFEENTFDYSKKAWSIASGDYNNDGYEDIMITSHPYASTHSLDLYKNDKNGNFVHVKEFLNASKSKFVDIDNDGDLDIAILGHFEVGYNCFLQFYINNGNDNFIASENNSLVTDSSGDIEIADYDNDGDNDILISGNSYSFFNKNTKLYKNELVEENQSKANVRPTVPENLTATINFNRVNLKWKKSTDKETPQASITYNVYIRKDDGSFITSPLANINSGYKKNTRKGNAGFINFMDINCLKDGKYYWSVQAVDNSNLGSYFAEEGSFEINGTQPDSPSNLTTKTISDTKVLLKWQDNSTIEDGFVIEMYVDNSANQKTSGFYECKRVYANVTECEIDNLTPETEYIFRAKAFNCSSSSIESDICTISTYPIPFTKNVILDNQYGREAEWGDFDNDGDLDILMFYTDDDAHGKQTVSILENISGKFEALSVSFSSVEYFGGSRNGSLNWVDFNSDGLLDVCLIKGQSFSAKMSLYVNNGDKSFTKIEHDGDLSITPGSCGPAFADYDNDGDMDMLLMGHDDATFDSRIIVFDNDGANKFVKSNTEIIGAYVKSRAPWCDFNGDGYLDILAFEKLENGSYIVVILKNNGDKSFTKISYENLQGLNSDVLNQSGDARWGDYNNDSYPDILISGAHTSSNGIGITRIYKNNGDESFSDTGFDNIYGMAHDVSIEWGDYNNDGILDILQTGDGWINGVRGRTRIFYNINGQFEMEPSESFLGVHQQGMSTAADYDNDGDLDILNLGEISYTHHQIALFENFQSIKNLQPNAPTNLRHIISEGELILEWDKADDYETPSMGLSYNVYLKIDTSYIISPNALSNGKRTIMAEGNANQNTFIKIKHLENGVYRWGVQSIDNCFEGSEFADGAEVEIDVPIDESVTDVKHPSESRFNLFPNPCSKSINIYHSAETNIKYQIEIYDVTGTKLIIKKDALLPFNIDVTILNPGIYFVKIMNTNTTIVQTIVKK